MEPLLTGSGLAPTSTRLEASGLLLLWYTMAADGTLTNMIPVLARRNNRGMKMTMATRLRGQQEEGNNVNYGQKRNATTNFGDSNMESDTTRRESQPTPSAALVNPLSVMEDAQPLRSESPAPSTTAMAYLTPIETPTGTIQTDNDAADDKSTVQSVAISSRITGAEAGAKIGTEALPGVNQDDPKFATAPQVTPFAPVEAPAAPSSTPANTVYKPMPGKNQPDVAVASLDLLDISSPALSAPSPPPVSTTTMTTYVTLAQTLSGLPSASPDATLNSAFSWPTPAASSLSSSTPSISSSAVPSASSFTVPSITSLPPLPSTSSFVLLTRSEQDKEQKKTSSFSILTPQAITAPSSLLSATVLPTIMASPSSLPSTASDELDGGLTPLSRSLFILFGVLGKQPVPSPPEPTNLTSPQAPSRS